MDSFMNAYFTLYYSKYVKGSQEKFKAMILLYVYTYCIN